MLYQAKNGWQCARASSRQPKRAGKSGRYFIVLNCDLRVRVVVRDMRAAVAPGDIQIGQQRGHRLGAHAGTPIGMQGQHAWRNIVACHGLGDELLGQLGTLAQGDHPAHHESAEDVQDHVQMKARPLGWSFEFGDVPGPDLVGRRRQQFGFGIGRMGKLIAPLRAAAVGRQQAVHGAHRCQIAALIEQRGVHRRWRGVGETCTVERGQQRLQSATGC